MKHDIKEVQILTHIFIRNQTFNKNERNISKYIIEAEIMMMDETLEQ